MEFVNQDTFARGDIATVLDLTSRDGQDDILYPLTSETTLFTVPRDKKPLRTSPSVQYIGPRGPTTFGSKCVFDLQSSLLPDMIHHISLQINLDHWIPASIRAKIEDGTYNWPSNTNNVWEYANALGVSIIEEASFEIGDTTIEKLTGEYIAAHLYSIQSVAEQVVFANDLIGSTPVYNLSNKNPQLFPTENGVLTCILPFFFSRNGEQTAFPLVSCKDNDVRVIIKLRQFEQLVRQLQGYRNSCDSKPQGTQQVLIQDDSEITINIDDSIPAFKECNLVIYGQYIDTVQREKYIKHPHEVLYKQLYINTFSEPLQYATISTGTRYNDTIQFMLPLEMNGPIQDIKWILRRKAVVLNNDWTTFGPVQQIDYSTYNTSNVDSFEDPIVEAKILLNGMELVKKSGEEFRKLQSQSTAASANNWLYSYSLAPGHINTSKIQSIQLALTVKNTLPLPSYINKNGFGELNGWEVFVFTDAINWLRFENKMVGRVFQ
jgi:hypothetical protein